MKTMAGQLGRRNFANLRRFNNYSELGVADVYTTAVVIGILESGGHGPIKAPS